MTVRTRLARPLLTWACLLVVAATAAPAAAQDARITNDVDTTLVTVGDRIRMTVTVEHKNEAETSWTAADTFDSITGIGVATKDISNLKEQIRFAFTFTTGSSGDGFWVVVAAPAWRPYA